ncbi:GldG family protein [Anabaena sp. CCY 9402-a]|uniref:GldG family protein n=1 Tax=Anabaena sp. CCY 9402-a TaxID=3103867 RepID=UPI0039C6F3BD
MTTIKQKQLWKYLFLLGPFFTVAGLTAGLVADSWGVVPLVLLITGIIICGLWVAWQSQRSQWWKRRSTQAGTNALVATLAVLLIVGLINFLATRYQVRTDLTDTQLFTISPQSQELVRNLKQPIKLWVFDVNQNPQDRELLANYRRQSSKFQFEYVDPQGRPGLAEKFGVKDYGEVYLEAGDKRQLVQSVNVNERLSEIKLTNKLQQLYSDRIAKVYFLQGHGEHPITTGEGGMSQAIQGLSDKNYTASPLSLTDNPKVPDDADVVVVAGPKRELFDAEVKALQAYLNGGGNVLLMVDPNTNPNLNSLLQEWGVRLDDRLAVDVSGAGVGLGPAAPIVRDYGQHPITQDFRDGISFYRLARPLEITPVAGVQSTPLLQTKPYPDSWAESDLQSEKLEFNPDKDLKGPLTLGVALSKTIPAKPTAITAPTTSPTPQTQASPTTSPTTLPTPQNQASPTTSPTPQNQASPTPSPTTLPTPQTQASPTEAPQAEQPSEKPATESRLVVIGNSDFVTDRIFQQQLNGDVFLNSVTWLSQQDQQPLSIRPKEPKNRRITMSAAQANFLTLSSVIVLPLIGFITAVAIWWKRR